VSGDGIRAGEWEPADALTLSIVAGARVLLRGDRLEVEGHGPLWPADANELAAPLEVVAPASLASLRQALRRWSDRPEREYHTGFATLWLTELPAAKFRDPDRVVREPIEFHWWNDEFAIVATTVIDPEDGMPDVAAIERLIAPALQRNGASASVDVDTDEADYGGYWGLIFSLDVRRRGTTVGEAYKLAKDILELVDYAEDGEITRERALDLLRSGRVDVLLGRREGDWLDCKRTPYPKTDEGRLELAKDVAAFANADGGVLAVGVATRKANDGEIASAVMPCTAGAVNVLSYRRTIQRRVHPYPERLEIFSISERDGEVWIISIPPQPEELKPFLVHGAVLGRKLNDNYFSIVTRREDEAVPTTTAALHGLLSAGRAALRRSETRKRSSRRTK
jgi:hypothetical protein